MHAHLFHHFVEEGLLLWIRGCLEDLLEVVEQGGDLADGVTVFVAAGP